MKCPVCKNIISEQSQICPFCKFNDLGRTFLNAEEAACWMEMVVIPYRNKWKDKDGTEALFNQMFSQQILDAREKSYSEKRAISNYKYKPYQDGIMITCYMGAESTVVIPSNIDGQAVRGIDSNVFEKCNFIEHIEFPDTINYIGEHACYSCKKIKDIIFPKNVTRISKGVCDSCSSLETVVIKGARIIETFAFNWCKSLKNIYLPETLETIEFSALPNSICFGHPRRIILPSSLKKIGGYRIHII